MQEILAWRVGAKKKLTKKFMNTSPRSKKVQPYEQVNRSLDSNHQSLPIKDSKIPMIKNTFYNKIQAYSPIISERIDPIIITINSPKKQPQTQLKKNAQNAKQTLLMIKKTLQQDIKSMRFFKQKLIEQDLNLQKEHRMLQDYFHRIESKNVEIENKQQMFKFKVQQLKNLMKIHEQIIEGANKDIRNEQTMNKFYQEKKAQALQSIEKINSKKQIKDQLVKKIEFLQSQKSKFKQKLEDLKKTEKQKQELRSQTILDQIKVLIKENQNKIQYQLQTKMDILKSCVNIKMDKADLKRKLKNKGITQSMYLTRDQLKKLPQFNSKNTAQSIKILEKFQQIIQIATIQIKNQVKQNRELKNVKEELTQIEENKKNLQNSIRMREDQIQKIQQKQAIIQKQIEQQKAKLANSSKKPQGKQ